MKTVKAQIVSVTHRSTTQGKRVYAVFNTVDGRNLGIWVPECPKFKRLQVGDRVLLRCNAAGQIRPQFTTGFQQLVLSLKNLIHYGG